MDHILNGMATAKGRQDPVAPRLGPEVKALIVTVSDYQVKRFTRHPFWADFARERAKIDALFFMLE
jgi:hypothetical protein